MFRTKFHLISPVCPRYGLTLQKCGLKSHTFIWGLIKVVGLLNYVVPVRYSHDMASIMLCLAVYVLCSNCVGLVWWYWWYWDIRKGIFVVVHLVERQKEMAINRLHMQLDPFAFKLTISVQKSVNLPYSCMKPVNTFRMIQVFFIYFAWWLRGIGDPCRNL